MFSLWLPVAGYMAGIFWLSSQSVLPGVSMRPDWLRHPLQLYVGETKYKQEIPFLRSCTDIIAIGRFKWIPGTKNGGKDNYAWCRFDARHTAGPVYHPFRSAALLSPAARACAQCGVPYRPQRSDSRFCSDTCRQRAHRGRLAVTQP